MQRDDRDLTPTPALSATSLGAGLPPSAVPADDRVWSWLLGVAICSLLPALFWCGVIWFVAPLFGLYVSPSGLTAIGSSIALFLTLISSVLLARA